MLLNPIMSGFVTERDFAQAEAAFPGIEAFYRGLTWKPPTFLDLVRLYLERAAVSMIAASPRAAELPRGIH